MQVHFAVLLSLVGATLGTEISCGGTYRGSQYTITSPDYPRDYPGRLDCEYRLEGDAVAGCEQRFRLQFLDFEVRVSEDCRADYVQVGERNVLCGRVAGIRKFRGTNNSLVVKFHTDEFDADKGFKILVTQLPCDPKFDSLNNLFIKEVEGADLNASQQKQSAGDNWANSLNPLAKHVKDTRARQLPTQREINFTVQSNAERERRLGLEGAGPTRITSYLFLPPDEGGARGSLIKDKAEKGSEPVTPARFPGGRPAPAANQLVEYEGDASDPSARINYAAGRISPGSSSGLDYDSRLGILQPALGYSGSTGSYRPSTDYLNGAHQLSAAYPSYGLKSGSSYYSNTGYNQPGANYPNFPDYHYSYNNPGYSSGFHPIVPNYNPVYSPDYNSDYNPTYNYPGYNPNYGNGWGNGIVGQYDQCCKVKMGRRFTIVSPGFPGEISSANSYSCRYTVTKITPDVCRIRINFKFFNFGEDDRYCNYGYLEIDGRRYCGCKTGLSLTMPFSNYIAKTITIVNTGHPKTKFRGFLIDAVQESCGTSGPYFPYNSYQLHSSNPFISSSPYNPNYSTYTDYSSYLQRREDKIDSSKQEQSNLISQNVTVISPSPIDPIHHNRAKRESGYSYPRPGASFQNRDLESISNIDGKNDRIFSGSCQNRAFLDWAIAAKEAFIRNARCIRFESPNYWHSNARSNNLRADKKEATLTDCEYVNSTQGFIKSPLYPHQYPDNINKCYRFKRTTNACKVEIGIEDFDLESSAECSKDYLIIDGENKKYCGHSLTDVKKTFDLRTMNHAGIYFSSDSQGTGRGFNISFIQLPC